MFDKQISYFRTSSWLFRHSMRRPDVGGKWFCSTPRDQENDIHSNERLPGNLNDEFTGLPPAMTQMDTWLHRGRRTLPIVVVICQANSFLNVSIYFLIHHSSIFHQRNVSYSIIDCLCLVLWQHVWRPFFGSDTFVQVAISRVTPWLASFVPVSFYWPLLEASRSHVIVVFGRLNPRGVIFFDQATCS